MISIRPVAGATSWECPACGVRVRLHFPVFVAPVCPCGRALMTYAGDDLYLADCGDFALRVVPTWE